MRRNSGLRENPKKTASLMTLKSSKKEKNYKIKHDVTRVNVETLIKMGIWDGSEYEGILHAPKVIDSNIWIRSA